MQVGHHHNLAVAVLPGMHSRYSPSSQALEVRLLQDLSSLREFYASGDASAIAALGEYLLLVDSQRNLTPKAFHDSLWKAVGAARLVLIGHSEHAAKLETAHNLLVRNSTSGTVLGDDSWIAGPIDEIGKVYYAGELKRAAVGLTREPFLWEAPSLLLALSRGREHDPHVHERTIETGLSFAVGTRSYRDVGTAAERVEIETFGTWTVVSPGEMHRVDSSDAQVAGACFGCSVALPGAGLDRVFLPSHVGGTGVDFEHRSSPIELTGVRGVQHFLGQIGEGAYAQYHLTVEPGTVLRVGAFSQRAKGTIVAAILVGGDFVVRDGSREIGISGEGIVLSDGEPLTFCPIRRSCSEVPMQLGLTVALSHGTPLSDALSDDLLTNFSVVTL